MAREDLLPWLRSGVPRSRRENLLNRTLDERRAELERDYLVQLFRETPDSAAVSMPDPRATTGSTHSLRFSGTVALPFYVMPRFSSADGWTSLTRTEVDQLARALTPASRGLELENPESLNSAVMRSPSGLHPRHAEIL